MPLFDPNTELPDDIAAGLAGSVEGFYRTYLNIPLSKLGGKDFLKDKEAVKRFASAATLLGPKRALVVFNKAREIYDREKQAGNKPDMKTILNTVANAKVKEVYDRDPNRYGHFVHQWMRRFPADEKILKTYFPNYVAPPPESTTQGQVTPSTNGDPQAYPSPSQSGTPIPETTLKSSGTGEPAYEPSQQPAQPAQQPPSQEEQTTMANTTQQPTAAVVAQKTEVLGSGGPAEANPEGVVGTAGVKDPSNREIIPKVPAATPPNNTKIPPTSKTPQPTAAQQPATPTEADIIANATDMIKRRKALIEAQDEYIRTRHDSAVARVAAMMGKKPEEIEQMQLPNSNKTLGQVIAVNAIQALGNLMENGGIAIAGNGQAMTPAAMAGNAMQSIAQSNAIKEQNAPKRSSAL